MAKRKWTEDEIKFMKENYETLSATGCAKHLGREVNSVKKFATRIGVAKKRRNFTKEEIAYILKHYANIGAIPIAKELGVKKVSIHTLVQKRLHLRCNPEVKSKNASRTNKLWVRTEETKRKISEAKKYPEKHCIDCNKKISLHATRCRKCNRKYSGGEKHMWWNGGVTSLYDAVASKLYPVWKYPILCRDNFMCQVCGIHDKLEVHHLRKLVDIRKSVMAMYPDLHPERDKEQLAKLIVIEHKLEEGITLCYKCHKKVHFEKSGEFQESLTANGEGNLKPIQSYVRNIVDWQVQRLIGEDSQSNKPDTSAGHSTCKSEDIVCTA